MKNEGEGQYIEIDTIQ